MAAEHHLEICNGPSKRDLDLALFDGKLVIFMTSEKYMLPSNLWQVYVDGVDRVCGENNQWNIRGTIINHGICKHNAPLKTALKYVELVWYPHNKFQGSYNTQNRKGWIEF
jgi:hypothetical protein